MEKLNCTIQNFRKMRKIPQKNGKRKLPQNMENSIKRGKFHKKRKVENSVKYGNFRKTQKIP